MQIGFDNDKKEIEHWKIESIPYLYDKVYTGNFTIAPFKLEYIETK